MRKLVQPMLRAPSYVCVTHTRRKPMSRPLICGLVAATVLALASTTPSQAALNCKRGNLTDNKCITALNKQLSIGKQLVACIQAMQNEYLGTNNDGAGAGRNFNAKKNDCAALAAQLTGSGGNQSNISLVSASGDLPAGLANDEDVQAAAQAIQEWTNK